MAPPVSAQGLGGFEIEQYDSEITVNLDGTITVLETIKGSFSDYRHGLFRYIPTRYADTFGSTYWTPLKPDVVRRYDVVEEIFVPEPYEQFREGQNEVFKIGDAGVTHIGPFVYQVGYTVENALLFHELNDELFWNVTGNDWGVPLPNVTATVIFEGVPAEEFSATCFTGEVGSIEKSCAVNASRGQVMIQGQGPLTVSVLMPSGLIQAPTSLDQFRWWLAVNWDWFLLFIPIITLGFLVHAWWHHGKDPKGRGTIIAEYEPPNGLLPSEIGTLVDTHVHANDFSAGIVDLAVRGYVQIIEEPKDALGVTIGKRYRLKKLKEADETLKAFEKEILKGVFDDKTEVELSKRKVQLARTREKVAKMVHESMAKQGYYAKNPATTRMKYIGIGITIAVIGHILGIFAYIASDRPVAHISFFGTAGLFVLFGFFMPKKTEKGAIAYDLARGFKLFLEKAEKYRIQWQEQEGIFEKYLPYAMVFGVADKWAKALAVQAKQAPAWYVGGIPDGFNAETFSNSVSSFVSTASTVSRPSSSGGSGGGGFSGGGFGGGGGGSW